LAYCSYYIFLVSVYNYPTLSLDKMFVKVYINNMKTNNKKGGFVQCTLCHCVPAPDQWSANNPTMCIDCA